MRTSTVHGPFCRDCGLATVRGMSADTLVQGWWGLFSLVITPFVLLANHLGPRRAFAALPAPAGGFRPPLDPGKPVWRRPQGLLFAVPAGLLVLAVVALLAIGVFAGDGGGDGERSGGPLVETGDCVRNDAEWPDQDLKAVDCDTPGTRYTVIDRPRCAPGDYLSLPSYSADGTTTYCLHRRG
ncbi:hypothetical protein [Streptomyces sp. NPDC058045]|uniref:LppU/SCO3897 family protein n=1 Tax=Streptomyces sp. NPDC058045 TaxID=3346311 RepID=UPI0036EDCA3C